MATYKMIQDIEAEDHILGPLSLRQFIYALIAAFLFYINFLCVTKHVAFLLIVFLPPALFAAFFAFPFGGDQPTEVWALAKVRFWFKPRRRIWDQSGIKDLVTVTVPKKIERNLTNGLTQTEVKSRLSALANTIDSRGWAVKNVNVNMSVGSGGLPASSDRLIDLDSLPREVPNDDVHASDDIMDAQSNPIAQQFDHMINASTQAHHQQLVNQMNTTAAVAPAAPVTPDDYWFMHQNPQPAVLTAQPTSIVSPGLPAAPAAPTAADASDEAFMAQLRANEANDEAVNAHLHTLQPYNPAAIPVAVPAAVPAPVAAGPEPPSPAILSLAGNNDLNISTIAREAHKSQGDGQADGEVVISLR